MASSTPVDEVFLAALEKPTLAERNVYLDEVCQNDPELRRRVERLLAAHPQAEGFLESPPSDVQRTKRHGPSGRAENEPPEPTNDLLGTVIAGRYKLVEEIAEGGMGTVWVAEQTEPVRRRVAVKLIKPGMDSRQVLSRFEVERQALALMDHPNIAKVLDGGVTEQGRPYFVMEYVKGVPITDFCDQARLSVTERLKLFVQVCQAVQHAHQKGIIHRDLKPSNILVCLYDGRPVPKVIDFGLAKAMHQPLTEHTLYTAHGVMVGTPLYMSPEQAEFNNLDIDTRSDVYSLGVLLYELLTGATPLERERFKEAALQEILRLIKEEEPTKPSTKLSGSVALANIAAQRGLEPAQLSRAIRGDLDWIVMKALEKERSRRYDTANGLARDIERYLHDDPVEATPPSARYRFSKFARRNRAALVTALLLSSVLIAGTVVSTWQAVRAMRAERAAQAAQSEEAQQRKIAEEQRNAADASRAAEAEQRRLAEAERAEAEKQRAAAEANFQKARAAVDEYFTLVSESTLFEAPGFQPLRKELLEAALRFYQESATSRANDPAVLSDLAVTQLRIGLIYQGLNRPDDWIAATRRALDVVDRLQREYPDAKQQEAKLAGFWRGLRTNTGKINAPSNALGALTTMSRLERTWKQLADRHPDVVAFQNDLAAIEGFMYLTMSALGQPKSAEKYSRQGQAILEKLVHEHPSEPEYRQTLAIGLQTLAWELGSQGRKGEGLKLARRAVALGEELVAQVPTNSTYRHHLVESLMTLNRQLSEAELRETGLANLRRAMQVAEQNVREFPNAVLYQNHWLWATESAIAMSEKYGDTAQLEATLRALVRYFTFRMGQDFDDPYPPARLAVTLCTLATCLEKDPDRAGRAEELRRQAKVVLADYLENVAQGNAQQANSLAWHLVDKAPVDPIAAGLAVPIARQAAEAAPDKGYILNTLGVALYRSAQYAEAVEVLRRTRVLGGSSIDNDGAFLAMAYAKLNEPEKATRWFRAVEGWMALFSGNTRFYAEAAETLGVTPQPPKSKPMTIENEQRAAQLAIEADPAESRWVHAWLADRAAARGEWQAASEGFGLAIAQTPDEAYLHYKRAIVQLKAGDPSGFRSSCAAIVERFSQSADPEALHWLAWTCSLAPDALETWNVPLEAAGKRQGDVPDPGIYLLGLGALQYRAGRFDDAASRLREARDALKLKPSEKTSPAYATLFLCMAQARLGHDEESRKWLAQAKAEIELEGLDSMSWNRRATMDLLQAEAERLLATTP